MGRPYGFEANRIDVRPDEAAVIREAADKILTQKQSLAAVVRWLNQTDRLTKTGRLWEVTALKRTLTSPLVAGLVEEEGELVPARTGILSPDERAQLIAQVSGKELSPRSKYLLTAGLAVCGRCKKGLIAAQSVRDGEKKRAYVCPPPTAPGKDHAGCGRIRCLAEPLEDHVAMTVLAYLATPEAAEWISRAIRENENNAEAMKQQVEQDEQKLVELAREWTYGSTPMAQHIRPLRDELNTRIRRNRRALEVVEKLQGTPIYAQAMKRPTRAVKGRNVLSPENLAEWWQAAEISSRRALLEMLVTSVEVGPVRLRGSREFDTNRVKINWRVRSHEQLKVI